MRSAQVQSYGKPIAFAEVPEPTLRDPHDVIVRIAGAGICRTDVHILHGELDAAFHPPPLAPHPDAGLTAMHAVRRLAPYTNPATTVVTFGAGGVGQVAIQLLRMLTPARLVVVEIDAQRAAAARRLGAHVVFELAPAEAAEAVRELTDGVGAQVVLDLVGEGEVPQQAMNMLAKGGVYSIVGYGGFL